jgi:hypothetical protein
MKHEKCNVINDVTLHHKLSISQFNNGNCVNSFNHNSYVSHVNIVQ